MAVVTLRIDGQAVAVPAGSSLLAASRVAGLALPVLCHLDGLTPVGACRRAQPPNVYATPVRRSETSQSSAATASSRERAFERTFFGWPHSSKRPSGP